MATIVAALLFILSLCALAPVVSQSQEPAQPVDTIKISTDLVVVDALVTSQRTGRVISGLKADDFQLYEDKVKQTITHFSRDRLPLALVVAFDVFTIARGVRSPSPPDELLLRKDLLEALQRLKPEDEVAVMPIDCAGARWIEDFSRDTELITHLLVNIWYEYLMKAYPATRGRACLGALSGSTIAFNQAMYKAATLLNERRRPGLRTAIIVASRVDKSLRFPFSKSQQMTLEALLELGTTVNGLVSPNLPNHIAPVATPWRLLSRSGVSKYVKETGGDLVKIEGIDAGKKLGQAIDRLRARYSLGYLPTNEKWDGKFRRISLTVTPEVEKREGKVIVQVRKGYFAKKPTHETAPDPGGKGG